MAHLFDYIDGPGNLRFFAPGPTYGRFMASVSMSFLRRFNGWSDPLGRTERIFPKDPEPSRSKRIEGSNAIRKE